jgi:hypothetical protein
VDYQLVVNINMIIFIVCDIVNHERLMQSLI